MIARTRLAAATLLAVAALSSCSTNVTDLEVGQCVRELSAAPAGEEAEEVASLPVVDCAEPHLGEVYALHELPEGEFPGAEALEATSNELCAGPEYTEYVGVAYDESEIPTVILTPLEEGWAFGDREVACLLATADETPTTGSLRGANR